MLNLLLTCKLKNNNWLTHSAVMKPKASDDDESSESESNEPDCFTSKADDEDEQMKS
ncbi:MAG: hypothetical protein M1835_000014 [Candelina submexicana]|nr:MAG: hypothetical protein M1835_000014 [Candelina submexicana]